MSSARPHRFFTILLLQKWGKQLQKRYGDLGIAEQQKVRKQGMDDGIKQFSIQPPTYDM